MGVFARPSVLRHIWWIKSLTARQNLSGIIFSIIFTPKFTITQKTSNQHPILFICWTNIMAIWAFKNTESCFVTSGFFWWWTSLWRAFYQNCTRTMTTSSSTTKLFHPTTFWWRRNCPRKWNLPLVRLLLNEMECNGMQWNAMQCNVRNEMRKWRAGSWGLGGRTSRKIYSCHCINKNKQQTKLQTNKQI